MSKIKMIATDLDGTLLSTIKTVSKRNIEALAKASEKGVIFVPSTGRHYAGVPETIRSLSFVDYVSTLNGACVLNNKTKEVLYDAEMNLNDTVEAIKYVENLGLRVAVHVDGMEFISTDSYNAAREIFRGVLADYMLTYAQPVSSLTQMLLDKNMPVQKFQFFCDDLEYKQKVGDEILSRFPDFFISSSMNGNSEVNNKHANKGEAIIGLGAKLGIAPDEIMTFGDSTNDLTMIEMAGLGVAMENGNAIVKKAAKFITKSCDEDGVAYAVEKFVLNA